MVNLSELLRGAVIFDEQPAVAKPRIIEQLVTHVAQQGWIPMAAIAEVTQAVLHRELLGTTGIGCGIAVPHARWGGLKRPLVLLARYQNPVDFDSLDQEPVDLFSLCLAPIPGSISPDRELQDRAMWLMRQYSSPRIRARMRRAQSAHELVAVLQRADQRLDHDDDDQE